MKYNTNYIFSFFNRMMILDSFKNKIDEYVGKLTKRLNQELVSYVEKEMIYFDSKLEEAINIYLLLGDVLRYNENYAFFKNYKKVLGVSNINLINNLAICNEWSLIFSKLLNKYGIKARAVNEDLHYYVLFYIDDITYIADATKYGFIDGEYSLSDFANIKSNFRIERLSVFPATYYSFEKFSKECEKLDKAIDNVYKKTNRKVINLRIDKAIGMLKKRIQNNITLNEYLSEKDLLYRLKILNIFYNMNLVKSEIEKKQLINKYCKEVFFDIMDSQFKMVTLFKMTNKNIKFYSLIIICNNDCLYYYLETDDGFCLYNETSKVLEKMYDDNLFLKDYDDIGEVLEYSFKGLKLKY